MRRVGPIVYGADQIITEWVAQRIPGYITDGNTTAIGVWQNDRIEAGVLFERYNGVHCEICLAAEPGSNWFSRRLAKACFSYIFEELNCRAFSGLVSTNNPESMKFCIKIGCKPEAIIKFAAPDGSDLIVMKMFKEECRWLNGSVLKRKRAEAA